MKIYFYGFIMLWRKFILRRNTGQVICDFAEKMGVVYIKMAQILAMQNVGEVFTEADRTRLAKICDQCQPIPYAKIEKIICSELSQEALAKIAQIDHSPLGSASISQVHRATLQDGQEIVLKIKRQDITRHIQRTVRQLKRLLHLFGHITPLRNFLGSDKALNLWADWILQETDFEHECHNLEAYQQFAENVNGRIRHTKRICVPQLFPEFTTQNIIAMEYISAPTINRTELTAHTKSIISQGLNDYISLSFWAMLHGEAVVFHGDPHGGNIYFDAEGNIGFLDMGLVFAFDAEESRYVRQLFLNAYSGKAEEIVDMLIERSQYKKFDREQLIAEVQRETNQLHQISVTQFFVEMIGIFTRYNIAPPDILFKMAKSFMAIFGINNLIENETNVETLLSRQVVEYYLNRTGDNLRSLAMQSARSLWEIFQAYAQDGVISGGSATLVSLQNLTRKVTVTLQDMQELFGLMGIKAGSSH